MKELTIPEIQAEIKAGNVTALQLTDACLKQIQSFDQQGPSLNAIISVNPEAQADAAALDESYTRRGFVGPLHGIPVLLKDNINTAGLRTTAGSVCLSEHIPQHDAFIVKRLRQAGAIIIAKANLHEFAVWGETVSSLQGQTKNPYDLTRTPGGSSGGTGAGIAAGYAVAGIGTDTVNSVRSPASANCLVGLRPTLGLVSRGGLVPYSQTQDTAGPITRCVLDAAILMDVLAGYDPADGKTAWCVGNIPRSYSAGLTTKKLKGRKIGVMRNLFGIGPEHEEVNDAVERCLRELSSQGVALVDVEEEISTGRLVEDVSVHLYDLEPDLNPYLQALPPTAQAHSLKEIIASGRFHPGIGENIRKAVTLRRDSGEYTSRLAAQARLRDHLIEIMVEKKLDAFVFPHQKRLVVKIGESQVERNGVLASVTGFPSIVVPAGFSKPTATAPIGVPIGLEMLGRPWSEPTLLTIAYGLEQAAGARKPPVLLVN